MIRLDATGAVSVVRIDRDEQRNALDIAHCRLLADAVDRAVTSGARCIVVRGEGRAFCAGADLDEVGDPRFTEALYQALGRITAAPVPVVAAVHGPAIGAGLQLAIACDLRVADARARFSVPSARLGLAVDPWTIRRLALLAGGGPARRLLLACGELDAQEAASFGLADRLGTVDDAMALARDIAGLAPLTLAYSKRAIDTLLEPAVDDPALHDAFRACWDSDDFAEARRARVERRSPRFTGR